jgi:hypothetical protein
MLTGAHLGTDLLPRTREATGPLEGMLQRLLRKELLGQITLLLEDSPSRVKPARPGILFREVKNLLPILSDRC